MQNSHSTAELAPTQDELFNAILDQVKVRTQRQDGNATQLFHLYRFGERFGLAEGVKSLKEAFRLSRIHDTDMPESMAQALNAIYQLEPSELSLVIQLRALRLLAIRLGLYDADDLVKSHLLRQAE